GLAARRPAGAGVAGGTRPAVGRLEPVARASPAGHGHLLLRAVLRRAPALPGGAVPARLEVRSGAQHDGAGDAVVDAALVAVPDERRYGEAEQQRADHDRKEVGPVRPYRGDAHAEQAHAERGPDGADEQDVLYGEGGEADPGGARRVGAEQPAGDRPDADQPVDEERAEPAPEPGDRALAVL